MSARSVRQGRRRLVHQDDGRPQSPVCADGNALLHAAGERVGVGFFEAGEADILNQLSHCLSPPPWERR